MNVELYGQIMRFGCVGVIASLLHYASVLILVSLFEIQPLSANTVGFASAFFISYFGHRNWTFDDSGAQVSTQKVHKNSLRRFVLVALIGFIVNESIYALLLLFSSMDYRVGLLLAIGIASICTYFLSKLWAFNYV